MNTWARTHAPADARAQTHTTHTHTHTHARARAHAHMHTLSPSPSLPPLHCSSLPLSFPASFPDTHALSRQAHTTCQPQTGVHVRLPAYVHEGAFGISVYVHVCLRVRITKCLRYTSVKDDVYPKPCSTHVVSTWFAEKTPMCSQVYSSIAARQVWICSYTP
jgi:hypothetical protein